MSTEHQCHTTAAQNIQFPLIHPEISADFTPQSSLHKTILVTVLLINSDCNLMQNILSQLEEAVKGRAEHMTLLAIAC